MDVRNVVLGVARGPRIGDATSFLDAIPTTDVERAEVRERRLVSLRRQDRHGEAVRGDGAGERDLACGGSPHGARIGRDVDSPVLSTGVGVVAERELPEHLAVGRPGPAPCSRGGDQGQHEQAGREEDGFRCP